MYHTFRVRFQFPLLDEAGDGSGGGSQTPAAATPAASAQPVATPQATPASATPGATQPQATGGEAGREGWVPSYRIRETREAAIREATQAAQQQWGQKEAELQRELSQIRNQLHALVGVQPPADPEVKGIRDQFGRLYPGLSQLEERAQDLMGLIERAGDIESQNAHYWQTYGRQQTERLFSAAEKSLGAPLSEDGKRQLHTSFVGFVQSSPELTQRYASDPSIVDEFWQAFSSSLIDPARRASAATVAGRAAAGTGIPQDRGGTPPPAGGGPKPANLDERVASAWAQYQQNART